VSIVFRQETFRDDFTYRNSTEAVKRFPFPFPQDAYMYSVNIEPHVSVDPGSVYEHTFDIDEHYIAECEDRGITLGKTKNRFLALPHMMDAQWDTLELLMTSMARDYPDLFTLTRDGAKWHWMNKPLKIDQHFVFGDTSTLPYEPLEYISRQGQGDFILLDQREGNLWVDAGVVTTQADWSLAFDVGMSFNEWHGPVPMAAEIGVFDRALKFLLMLQHGAPVRRLNWTMTINPRLDTSPEHYDQWGPDRASVTPENVGSKVHLRVEVQTLFRLPRSNGVLFGVRCYLASLNDLVTNPAWGQRLHRVLRDLPQPLAEYKGLVRYKQTAVDWLKQFDHAHS